jgi:hypothetical protein
MAKCTIIGHLVNTYKALGYGFCLEMGWFTLTMVLKYFSKKSDIYLHIHGSQMLFLEKSKSITTVFKKIPKNQICN